MTVAVVVHPYAGAGVEGLRYGPPVAIACAVRDDGHLEANAAVLAVCPLWSVLVVPGPYRNSRTRRVRAVAVEHEADAGRVVIETEALRGN